MNACNGTYSFQLFVVVLDSCVVWEMLMLPSFSALAAPSVPSVRSPDGFTSNRLCEYVSFLTVYQNPPEDLPPGGCMTRTVVPEES